MDEETIKDSFQSSIAEILKDQGKKKVLSSKEKDEVFKFLVELSSFERPFSAFPFLNDRAIKQLEQFVTEIKGGAEEK